MLICDVLGITPYELLSGVENSSYNALDYVIVDKNSSDYAFLEAFRSANQDVRNRILGYMQAMLEK